nr:calcium-dependent protein kinase SK5-like [Quercus suber]
MVTRQSKDKYARLKSMRNEPLSLLALDAKRQVVAVLPSSTVTPPITRSKGKGKVGKIPIMCFICGSFASKLLARHLRKPLGTITLDELRDGLKQVTSELIKSEIKDLMDAADFDNSGTIDYGEFLAATMHLNKLEREENVLLAFSFFDKDGSGDITINELQQACRGFGLCDVHPEEMIKEIDQDKDGQIDYGEFAEMMKKGNGGMGRKENQEKQNKLGEDLGVMMDNGFNGLIDCSP